MSSNMMIFNLKCLKSAKVLAAVGFVACYALMANINVAHKTRVLTELRKLSGENGVECWIEPLATEVAVPATATKTLIASYPGSGKRFTWSVMSALSNHQIADDWNFSEKLEADTFAIKTSWPHREGVWSWGSMMDQTMLLLRNPRWAIPSYHSMRFELDYAEDWADTLVHVSDTYTKRPAIEIWENWRDIRFDKEIERWASFIDFWMGGGEILNADGEAVLHPRCVFSDIECKPKAVIDFDTLYTEHPTSEFFKIGEILDGTDNVEMVASRARACLLDKVYADPTLHNANRDQEGPVTSAFEFTLPQMKKMCEVTTASRDKYRGVDYIGNAVADDLVLILSNYVNQVCYEYKYMKMLDASGTGGTTDEVGFLL